MKVLVTGATSLIGRHTVTALQRRGDEVTTLQRSATTIGHRNVAGSLLDDEALRSACSDQDAVIHLAAKVGVTGDRTEYERINVDGTRRLLAVARSVGVRAFVHVSSPSVAHAGEPLVGADATPADPQGTRGHYATTKAEAELLALDASTDAMPVVAIRPHLVWGPGDTQLIGRVVQRAEAGRLVLVGDGAALIDTTYVDNAADALVAAADRAAHVGGRAFVVSNGEPRTVRELLLRITAAAGVAWTPRSIPAPVAIGGGAVAEGIWSATGRDDDPPMTRFLAEQLSTAHWFDQVATRDALDWRPAVSLAEGFERLEAVGVS